LLDPLDRLREHLARADVHQAVLSHPETLAHLVGFEQPFEDWPVAEPFTAAPPLLVLGRDDAMLLVPTFFIGRAEGVEIPVVETASHAFVGQPPDATGAFERAVAELPLEPGRLGVEARVLPLKVGQLLGGQGLDLVPVDETVVAARRRKLPAEVEAIRRASSLADAIQAEVKARAAPGISEAELAGLAQAAADREAGRRVPAVLTVTAGEATGTGGDVAGSRLLAKGDLVLTDTSPWLGGAWSDTANAVVVGEPEADQRRMFDSVRQALDYAIDLCRPGAVAGDVDQAVRESLSEWGPPYGHHTGHGIGASWCEPPLVIPGSQDVLEEGMVLAVEPAVYRPDWGGIRLEHVFVVRAGGNEILTEFEHTL
jgi:Xaa-Pro aminopeptidase